MVGRSCSRRMFLCHSQNFGLLKLIQLWDRGTSSAGRCECICMHSEVKTFGGWPGVKKGSKEATSLQEKHQGKTDILQKVQRLHC